MTYVQFTSHVHDGGALVLCANTIDVECVTGFWGSEETGLGTTICLRDKFLVHVSEEPSKVGAMIARALSKREAA